MADLSPKSFTSSLSTFSMETDVASPTQPEIKASQKDIRHLSPLQLTPGKPHEKFFFQNDFVVLKVESTLFNIPTFMLSKHSSKFERLLLSRISSEVNVEIITLKDTRALDFERILMVLFPSIPGQFPLSTVEEWTSVLTVAHNWEFTEITKLAINQLEPIASAVDKIVLGLEYNLSSWAEDGYIELCQRAEPISKDEGRRLGLDAVIDISSIRHHLRVSNENVWVNDSAMHALCSQSCHLLDDNSVAVYLQDRFSTDSKSSVIGGPSEGDVQTKPAKNGANGLGVEEPEKPPTQEVLSTQVPITFPLPENVAGSMMQSNPKPQCHSSQASVTRSESDIVPLASIWGGWGANKRVGGSVSSTLPKTKKGRTIVEQPRPNVGQ